MFEEFDDPDPVENNDQQGELNLAGFLFGNVNTKGELEQDQETSQFLSGVDLGLVSKLLQPDELSVFQEGDDDEDYFAHGRRPTEPSVFQEKAADAVDYADISDHEDDYTEESYNKGLSAYKVVTSSSTFHLPIDEDYDAEPVVKEDTALREVAASDGLVLLRGRQDDRSQIRLPDDQSSSSLLRLPDDQAPDGTQIYPPPPMTQTSLLNFLPSDRSGDDEEERPKHTVKTEPSPPPQPVASQRSSPIPPSVVVVPKQLPQTSDGLLLFSEVFAPLPIVPVSRPKTQKLDMPKEEVQYTAESDEEEDFTSVLKAQEERSKRRQTFDAPEAQLLSLSSIHAITPLMAKLMSRHGEEERVMMRRRKEGEEKEEIGQCLSAAGSSLRWDPESLFPSTLFYPLSQDQWEEGIVWEEDEECDEGDTVEEEEEKDEGRRKGKTGDDDAFEKEGFISIGKGKRSKSTGLRRPMLRFNNNNSKPKPRLYERRGRDPNKEQEQHQPSAGGRGGGGMKASVPDQSDNNKPFVPLPTDDGEAAKRRHWGFTAPQDKTNELKPLAIINSNSLGEDGMLVDQGDGDGSVPVQVQPEPKPTEERKPSPPARKTLWRKGRGLPPPDTWLSFPMLNEDLIAGNWLDSVVWDEKVPPAVAPPTKLIFDLNDHSMTLKVVSRDSLQQQASEIDKFNVSNDHFYLSAASKEKSQTKNNQQRRPLQHSAPAIRQASTKPYLTDFELRHFHRPRGYFPAGTHLRISLSKKDLSESKKQVTSGGEEMGGPGSEGLLSPGRPKGPKKEKDLSGREGRLISVEYSEEFPPVLLNMGMASRLVYYYRKKTPTDGHQPLAYDGGDVCVLEEEDESPFLGDVSPGETIAGLENTCFKAPLFRHQLPNTDFLLIRPRESRKMYIREMPTTAYLAAQILPKVEVPSPNSRTAKLFLQNRITSQIYRMFKDYGGQIRIDEMMSLFSFQSEFVLRKRLKDMAENVRYDDQQWWQMKEGLELPDEEDIRALVTPEAVCAYESMCAAWLRLREMGINHISTANGLPQAVQLLIEQEESVKDVARFIEQELHLTPWNVTANFLNSIQGKGLLQLTGLGDPSGKGLAMSFIRAPQKQLNPEKKTLKEIEKSRTAPVTGTDADLRKLSQENARLMLLKFGVPEEDIPSNRWARVDMVRKLSGQAALTGGGDGAMTKFARGTRTSVQVYMQHYKEQVQKIWYDHKRQLSRTDATGEDGGGENPDDFSEFDDLEKELESSLMDDHTSDNRGHGSRAQGGAQKRPPATKVPRRGRNTANAEEEDELRELEQLRKDRAAMEASKSSAAVAAAAAASTAISPPQLSAPPQARSSPPGSITGGPSSQAPLTPSSQYSEDAESVSSDSLSLSSSSSRAQQHGDLKGSFNPATGGRVPKRLKRKVRVRRADGTEAIIEEEITDPNMIALYMSQKEKLKRGRQLSPEEEAQWHERRQHKRAMDTARRQKKQEGTTKIVCGACGATGHMRTNRICPMYEQTAGQTQQSERGSYVSASSYKTTEVLTGENNRAVRTEEGKIRILKQALPAPIEKIKIPAAVAKMDPESLRKKRKGLSYGDLDYEGPIPGSRAGMSPASKLQRRRTATAPEVDLNALLFKVVNAVIQMPVAAEFCRPVNTKEFPDYKAIVDQPIDLGTIRSWCNSGWHYRTKQQFLNDISLMVSNCHNYCDGRFGGVSQAVDVVHQLILDELSKRDEELKIIESAITKALSEASAPTPTPSHPVDVMSPALSVSTPFPDDVSSPPLIMSQQPSGKTTMMEEDYDSGDPASTSSMITEESTIPPQVLDFDGSSRDSLGFS